MVEDLDIVGVDIGEGNDWWYVHGLTTHDKVYELNKQMCDIDKHLSEAGYFGMICEGQVEARKKLKVMKEKKTMTKAEAFEWLKGKKVNTKGEGKEVQMKLFECGFSWVNGQCRYYDFSDYLLFETDGKLWHCGEVGDSYWRLHHFEEISVEDILSIEIVEEKKVFSVDCALEHAKWIMKYLREECSPHTKMIIEGDHAELVEGVKSVVWKEGKE